MPSPNLCNISSDERIKMFKIKFMIGSQFAKSQLINKLNKYIWKYRFIKYLQKYC